MDEGPKPDATQLAAELDEARRRAAALELAQRTLSRGALVENLLDGFALLTANGVHLEVNSALCEMTGFSRDELIGAGAPHPYWPPDQMDAVRAAFAETLEGRTRTFPLTFVRKDGERFPVLVTPSVIRDESGAVVSAFATVKDMSELRRVEAALGESERLFRLTFDQAPIGAALVGLDFRFQRVNARFAQMTGYSAEELLERGFPDITHPEDLARDVVQVGRLAAGEREEYAREKRYVRKDGSTAWGDVVVRPIAGADGRPLTLLAMVADITERRRAELALQRSEDRFGLLFENTPEGVAYCRLIYDDAGRAVDWVYVDVNAAYKRLTRLTDVVGKRVTDLFPTITDDAPELFTTYGRVAETGDPEEFEIDFAPLGKWLHVSVRRPEPEHFLVLLSDISERKRAEQELLRQKETLARLVDSITDEVWLADAEGRFTLANAAALREFGAEAAARQDVAELVAGLEILRPDGTPRPPAEAPALRALRGETVRNDEEVVRTPASGELRHRLVNATPVFDADGAVAGSVSVVRDVTELRLAGQTLAREREHAKTYLDIAGVMLVAIAADQTVLFANPRTCEVLGRSEAEILGRNWFDTTLPEEEREAIRAGFAQLMVDNVAPWEFVENRVVTASGDERLIAWHNTVLRDADGTILATVSSGEDVTARKQTERLLAAPAEILDIVAGPTPVKETADGIVAALKRATGFDAVGLRLQEAEDYPFIGAVGYSDEFLQAENSLAERYPDGGLCRDAGGSISLECTCGLVVTGKTDPSSPLFTPGDSAWTNDSLPFLDVPPEDDVRLNPRNRCIHAGFRSLALVPLRAGDEILGLLHLADRRTDRFTPESVAFFEGLGASIGVALARKSAEADLRTAQEQLREAHRLAHIGAWRWHAATDTVTWTEELFRITGRDPTGEAPTFEQHADFIPPESLSRLRAAVEIALRTGEPYDLMLEMVRPDGAVRWVRSIGSALRDAAGEAEGLYGTFQDVTEGKRAEDEIRRLNAELEERVVSRTEQLEAATRELEALAYSMAHDVRAPLRTIDGFSAILMEEEASVLSPESLDSLRRVRKAAQTLAGLMDDLTGLSTVSRHDLEREEIDVSAIAAGVAAEMAAEHASRLVDVDIAPGLTARADPYLVRLIFRELLDNAWKFTAPRRHAHVRVGAVRHGDEQVYVVSDDGVGFDMAYATHLFGAFQRMHPPGEFAGNGIGLAMVQRLVRRHGGRVWADSRAGEGATFSFTLPLDGDR